jgi:hypothetical protein
LDTELSFPKGVKDSFLQASGYFTDGDDQNDFTGAGYQGRKGLFATSQTVQMISKIDADLFNSELYLINNIEIDIQITPNDNNFIIMQAPPTGTATAGDYVFEITSLKMFVKTVDLIDGLSMDVAKRLERQPSKYALRKTMLKHMFISENRTDFNQVF